MSRLKIEDAITNLKIIIQKIVENGELVDTISFHYKFQVFAMISFLLFIFYGFAIIS